MLDKTEFGLASMEVKNGIKADNYSQSDTKAMQKKDTKSMLAICFAGIFISYFIYGFLQEKITKGRYGDSGDAFTYMLALVFCQCVVNAAFAQAAIKWYAAGEDTAPQSMYAIMSLSYLGAMVSSNKALQYVSYPTQVLGKSAKPIPVMILGVVLARKRYPLLKYLFVSMIVIGVALFMYKEKKAGTGGDGGFGVGELLLLFSLALDGVTGGVQDKIRGEYITQTHRMMRNMNVWSIFYSAVGLIVTGEGVAFVVFATKYPAVLFNLLTFSLCSAVGQNFIFLTVTTFGPLMCSVFTTTRKFFTILGSVLLFAHPMSSRQWAGTLLVFMGLGLDVAFGKAKTKTKKPESRKLGLKSS